MKTTSNLCRGFSPADQMSPKSQTHDGDLVDLVFGACPLRIRTVEIQVLVPTAQETLSHSLRVSPLLLLVSPPFGCLHPIRIHFPPPPDSETSPRFLFPLPYFFFLFSLVLQSPVSTPSSPRFPGNSGCGPLRLNPNPSPFTMADAKKPAVLIIGGLGT